MNRQNDDSELLQRMIRRWRVLLAVHVACATAWAAALILNAQLGSLVGVICTAVAGGCSSKMASEAIEILRRLRTMQ